MKRRQLPFIAILFVLLLAATLVLLLRPSAPSAPPPPILAEENALDPVRAEMECIDGVVSNRNLKSEDVQRAIDGCRSQGASETRLGNYQ